LRQWKLWLAGQAVLRISEDENGMQRLALTFPSIVSRKEHEIALKDNQSLREIIDELRIKEDRLRKKSKVVRARNKEIKELKSAVDSRDELIEMMLLQLGKTKEQFLSEMLDAERQLEDTDLEFAEVLQTTQEALDKLNLAKEALASRK